MAERLRRRQDDDRAARSTNASLRNHRNRQRVLALQKPRLNHCATPACPGGQTGPSRAPLRRTRGGHFAPRGALPFATGTSLNLRLQRGHDWTPIEGQVSAPIDMPPPLPPAPYHLFAGGTGFEPSVPRQEKWSMPSSGDQTRVGRTLTLGGGAQSSPEGRDIELSVSPKHIRASPYDLCANRSDRRQSREGDRWFESPSLQRRVWCEPGIGGCFGCLVLISKHPTTRRSADGARHCRCRDHDQAANRSTCWWTAQGSSSSRCAISHLPEPRLLDAAHIVMG